MGLLVVVSPAKRLDFAPAPIPVPVSQPDFAADALALSRSARRLSVGQLQSLMSISPALATRARDQFRAFSDAPEPEAVKPALLAFAGDTYVGLDPRSLGDEDLAYAQRHLRILSGLYGLLRPMDLIQPYRLEMGSRLKTRKGGSLYAWWGDRLARALNRVAADTGARAIVNCASVEYFSAVDQAALDLPVITPEFRDMKAGEAKIVSFWAKRARGAMARFVVERRLEDPAALVDFETGGYRIDPDRSVPDRPVFLRDEVETLAENIAD
jgi:cytoplasmic iron level regulating protein YaaA (DUF328/UPF0246 family)